MDTLQTLVTTYGSSNSVAKILSSRDEGVYGWLTVNYLINGKYLAAENQVRIFLDPTMLWILGFFLKRQISWLRPYLSAFDFCKIPV